MRASNKLVTGFLLALVSASASAKGTNLVLVFDAYPGRTTAGVVFSAVKVSVRDTNGFKASGYKGPITVALGANPGGGTLSGTLTVNAKSGTSTFSNLSIDKVGTGYTLQASCCTLTPVLSPPFNIVVGPKKQLSFTVPPSNTTAGATISPPVQVTAQDAFGNAVTTYTGNIAVAIGANPSGGTLSGTTLAGVAAVGGVATFSNLSIDQVGTGYTLRATSGKLAAATSAAFDIATVGNFWISRTPMPTARWALGAAAINGILYAVGGEVNNGLGEVGTLESYNSATAESGWTTLSSMPTGRAGVAVAALNGTIYALGGYNINNTAYDPATTLEAYDPINDTWLTTTTPMPTARSYLGAAVINGTLYAVGGELAQPPVHSTGIYLTTLEAYDPSPANPAAAGWTMKAPMPTARYGVGAAAIGGVLYVVGGYGDVGFGSKGYLATLEAFDTVTGEWSTKASMSTARLAPSLVAIDGILYAVGGYSPSSNGAVATIEAYDPGSNTWTTIAPMPTARYFLGAAAIDGILYAVGGFSGPNSYVSLSELEAYQP